MKKGILSLAMAMVFGVASATTEPIEGEKKVVNAEKSKVTWKAYKVTGGHKGTVKLKEGALIFDNEKLTGGEFVVDMTSLVTTDDLGDMKAKLEGHLKSDDFFSVDKHQTSKLVFTKAEAFNNNSYTVTGNLTIKGITKPITFVVSVYGNKATATMKVDRTNYDIKFRSGNFFENLGDKTIYDDFDLVVDLEF